VSGGGNQGLYSARLPDSLTLQGEVHGSGPQGDVALTVSWREVSGPAPVSFLDPHSPTTSVVFTDPGTYVLQLEATDGQTTTAQLITITVDPAPSLQGASLVLAPSSPGPLTVGTPETLTATLTDAQSHPIGNFVVQFTVTGANPTVATVSTNAAGVATFTYAGAVAGTDTVNATAIGGTAQLQSTPLSIAWTGVPPVGSIAAQGWIGSPGTQTTIMGLVPITVASGVTVTSGTLSYWPATNPSDTQVLTTTAAGGPGATLATLDTTVLSNGTYVIDLDGTDDHSNHQDSEVLVTVAGDYKPGRVVVDFPEFTVPIAGIPISVGRRYDSLEREKVGDFGHGWSLEVGHPDLQVDQGNNVTITMPNGRRATFQFEIQPEAVGAIVLGFIAQPIYVPEPGVFGKLTSDGCNLLAFDPNNPDPICFASLFDPTALHYAPTTFKYTDPYGVVYTMGVDGTLKSIQDRNNNVLTFTPDGITSPVSGQTVAFKRDGQGRITKILTPTQIEYDYVYDAAGNLITAQDPPQNVFTQVFQYGYDGDHRLTSSIDASGHTSRTSTYDDAGRLLTDADALSNVTRYAYDVTAHTTTTTYPDTGELTQTFDDQGLLLSQTDQMGRTTTHQYDANRNEVKRTNALGEVTTYTYDANGNQTSSNRIALGEITTTTYNAFSQPLTTTNPVGNTTTIAYDDQGVPTSFADSMGLLATFTSSEHGLPLTVTDVSGKIVYLNYDASGDLTSRMDRLGRTTTYKYDGMGRKTSMLAPRSMVDPTEGPTFYTYDAEGDLLKTENPKGGGSQRHMDVNRNVQSMEVLNDPVSKQNFFVYDVDNHLQRTLHTEDNSFIQHTQDFRGNELTTTDEGNHVTSYTYDLAGELVKTTYADGTFTSQTYDALGRLATKTDERSHTTTYAYEPGCDCSDRLTSVTDPLGRKTVMTYDGMSRKTSTTDANEHQTSYVYDLRGHLIETDYADTTSTHDTYDTLGRRTSSTDQTNQTTHYGYDAEGQLTSVTDPLGHVTQYGYDPNGNLTSVIDANNHTTTYAYDAANRKTSRTLPLGMTETFTNDFSGNILSHTDFRGKTTAYSFDGRYPAGRLVRKVPDPSLGEPTVTYTYNTTSTRSGMVDATGTTTYSYDQRNRLLTKATPEGTLTYTYDSSGNVASIDSSNANGTSVGYAWDDANQLSTVTDNRIGGMTTAAYTATGRPASLAQPNGVGVSYAYDSLDRVTSMAWKKGASSAFASWAYTYNDRGQRLSSTELSGREAAYGYDVASRLTSETITGDPSGASGNGALTYNVDPVGNRSSRASTLALLGPQSFSYDSNDELTTDSYDPNGNTTSSGGHSYAYDFENRLVSMDGSAVTVLYDGDGNRVAKSAGGVNTKYLVDELNPTGYLQVMDEVSGGAVQVRYTFGNMLVSQTRHPSASPVTSFYGYDAHGNVAFLTDVTGSETDTYAYDAWGNLVGRIGITPNTRLYTGAELDADLGLVNLRARQYKPSAGRFLTLDPAMGNLMLPASLNRYLYANGDAINLSDPSGNMIFEYRNVATIGIAIVTATAGAVGTRLLAQRYFESVDSWPVPPMGEPQDPCLRGVLAAAAEWRAETNPILKFGKWIKMEALALICGSGV
jgi:RHS repeat-associated protein